MRIILVDYQLLSQISIYQKEDKAATDALSSLVA